MKRLYFIATILISAIVIITMFLIFSISENSADPAGIADGNIPEEIQAVPVEISEVRNGNIVNTISETGVIKPFHSVTVATETAGKIIKITTELGDYIRRGAVIASIDDELPKLALEQAEAQLINASTAFEKAKIDLERYSELRNNNEISVDEFENMKVKHELARATFLSNEAAVKVAQRQVRNTQITSPISGYIAEKNIEAGNIVSVHQPIVKVVDLETIKIDIDVSEQDVVFLKQNKPVSIRVDAFPDKIFEGDIYAISPEANSESHTFPIEIIMQNQNESLLRSGMIARVTMDINVIRDVVLIERDAVIELFGDMIVFVIKDGYAEKRIVVPGQESGAEIQVLSGVVPGEKIAVTGQYTLENNSRIRIQNQ